jgi:hypothetical protein
MESILYTIPMMNNKPNVPEKVLPGRHYSLWVDVKVNGWLLVAMLTAGLGDIWLALHKDCPFLWRVIIAIVPLPAVLLWVRSLARWIRGMDELHRRITLEACLFATSGALFVITAWQRLLLEGILQALFQPSRVPFEAISFPQYVLVLALIYFFYLLGHFIFNRRFK